MPTLYARLAGPAVGPFLQGRGGGAFGRADGGSGVPAGMVAAVYRRSLLWLAAPDQPLTLSVDPGQRGPLVLLADGPPEAVGAVATGAAVDRDGAWLWFGKALAVDLSGVALWDEPLPALPPEGGLALAAAIRSAAPAPGLEAGSAAALARGLEAGSAGAVTAAVTGLAGLGPGLTPAGDDFLAGVLAGLQARRDARAGMLAQAVQEAAASTTPLSRRLLEWAARGRYGEPVRALFASAARGEPLAEPLAALLAVGATSGAATAAGIRVGLCTAGGVGGGSGPQADRRPAAG